MGSIDNWGYIFKRIYKEEQNPWMEMGLYFEDVEEEEVEERSAAADLL